MAHDTATLSKRLDQLKAELNQQGQRVQTLIESAIEAAFKRDTKLARQVIDQDEDVDKADVDIEKTAVQYLADVASISCSLSGDQMRLVLTIVKVNNELERIADMGVGIAQEVAALATVDGDMPDTFRVLANSVIGIVRDANRALDTLDAKLATVVLASEAAVESFKKELLKEVFSQVGAGTLSRDQAFAMQEIANLCDRMSDHSTNIAEQALYVATGKIVRHTEGKWEEIVFKSED